MAQAIKRLYPEADFAFGPATENGFYYDVDLGDTKLTDEDLANIDERVLASWKADGSVEGKEDKPAAAEAPARPVGGNRQALRRAAGNAQAGKGARADAESDAVKPADSDAGLGEQFADERQQGFGMRATGRAVALAQLAIAPQGAGAAFFLVRSEQPVPPRTRAILIRTTLWKEGP
jgi:hypothetical protein